MDSALAASEDSEHMTSPDNDHAIDSSLAVWFGSLATAISVYAIPSSKITPSECEVILTDGDEL